MLDEIETEAERMRNEKLSLEEQLAEAKTKLELEEEKIKTGERFKAAFIKDDETGEESQEEPQKGSDASNNDDITKENGDDNRDEEVIDLDNCCDGAKKTEKVSEDQEGINASNEEIQDSNERTNDPQLAIGNGNERTDTIITIQDIFNEFRSQVQKDFTRVAEIIFPVAYREPVMSFLRPITVVVKDSVVQVYDMVKRYAITIFKDLQKRRTDTDGESEEEKEEEE